MELVCDGFEVIRTKDNTGYEACLKRLEKARAELNGKLSSDKRAVLSYDEYVKAHQNITHERVTEKSKQMEKLKMKKLKQKLQRYQAHLHEIDEMKSLDVDDTHQEEKRKETPSACSARPITRFRQTGERKAVALRIQRRTPHGGVVTKRKIYSIGGTV